MKIGSVNPCSVLYLYNENGKCIGECLDTPNCFAVACLVNPLVMSGKAFYEHFNETLKEREDKDIQERMDTYQKCLERFPESTQKEIDYHFSNIKFYGHSNA